MVAREGSPRFVAIAILSLFPAFAIAAESHLPAQLPESGSGPAPKITPEKPSESGVPAIPPSHMDPGIVHTPEKRGDSRGYVKPPNLDPSISKNPDVATSPSESINSRWSETSREPRCPVIRGQLPSKAYHCCPTEKKRLESGHDRQCV